MPPLLRLVSEAGRFIMWAAILCRQSPYQPAWAPPISCQQQLFFNLLSAMLGVRCCSGFSLAERAFTLQLWCTGFSLWWLLLFQSTGSRARGLCSCKAQAQ